MAAYDKMEIPGAEPTTPTASPPPIRSPVYIPEPPEEWTEAAAWYFIGELFGLYRDAKRDEDRTFLLVKILRAYLSLGNIVLVQPEHREMTMRMLNDIARQVRVYNTIQDPHGLVQKMAFRLRQTILDIDAVEAAACI